MQEVFLDLLLMWEVKIKVSRMESVGQGQSVWPSDLDK